MDKLFLIGYMGCGKSTLGRKLAQVLDWEFVDMDEMIEEQSGKSITELFSTKGETYFRNLESEAIKSFKSKNNLIISTGGGVPCFNDNMKSIAEIGDSIYIKVSPEELYNRVKNETDKRPLLAGKSKEELISFIAEKLEERSFFYEQASLVYDDTITLEEELIKSLIKNNS